MNNQDLHDFPYFLHFPTEKSEGKTKFGNNRADLSHSQIPSLCVILDRKI